MIWNSNYVWNFFDNVEKIRIKNSFEFRNKFKAYFYGNFLSTSKKYKVIPKTI